MSNPAMTLRDLFNQLSDVPVWQAALVIVVLWALNAYLRGLMEALIADWRASRRKPDLRAFDDVRKDR